MTLVVLGTMQQRIQNVSEHVVAMMNSSGGQMMNQGGQMGGNNNNMGGGSDASCRQGHQGPLQKCVANFSGDPAGMDVFCTPVGASRYSDRFCLPDSLVSFCCAADHNCDGKGRCLIPLGSALGSIVGLMMLAFGMFAVMKVRNTHSALLAAVGAVAVTVASVVILYVEFFSKKT